MPSLLSARFNSTAGASARPFTPTVFPFRSAMLSMPEAGFTRTLMQPLCTPAVIMMSSPLSMGCINLLTIP